MIKKRKNTQKYGNYPVAHMISIFHLLIDLTKKKPKMCHVFASQTTNACNASFKYTKKAHQKNLFANQTLQLNPFLSKNRLLLEYKQMAFCNKKSDCTKSLQGVEQNKAGKTKIEAIENNDDKVPTNKLPADGKRTHRPERKERLNAAQWEIMAIQM